MLDAQRLTVLVEVAHAGSITAAARRLGYTPSAVSQQLGKLEHEVGTPLIRRHSRGVGLTPDGEVLVRHAEAVVGELRSTEHAVREIRELRPTHLSVGAFASAGKALVPKAFARFRRSHPSVALTLLDLEPPDGYGLVAARELDLLITHRYPGVPLPEVRGLVRRRLLRDPLRLVLPADHPRARHQRISLSGLADEEWIAGSAGVPDRVCLEGVALAADVRLRVAYETRDYEVAIALIEAGLGIGLVPASVLDGADTSALAIRRLSGPAPAREIYLLHHRRPTPLSTEMIHQLHHAVAA